MLVKIMSETLAQAEKLIPAEVRMISGCRDDQTSADVSNVANFSLPDPAGRAGGACTSAMLDVCYKDQKAPDATLSFQDVLLQMREVLKAQNYTQVPQLTASRPLDIKQPFHIIPPGFSGQRRAVMIGINYVGTQSELKGCIADVKNMMNYIKDVHGFTDSDITMLLDDGEHTRPTRDNIMNAYAKVAAEAQPGDVVFCHYSGHGSKLVDDNGDEADGYDEALVPVDYNETGLLRDDDVFKTLVGPMKRGVNMTCIYDCCHSGTILDLPFKFVADGQSDQMTADQGFDFQKLQNLFQSFMAYQEGKVSAVDVAQEVAQSCCAIL